MNALRYLLTLPLFLAGLALLATGDSLFSDFRSENIAGPGVDAYVLNRHPAPGESVRIEVRARGGDRTGIEEVRVRQAGNELARVPGRGVYWGQTLSKSKSRGQDAVMVQIPQGTAVDLDVSYVCAMTRSGTFSNERFENTLAVSYTPSSLLADLSRPVLFALAWGVLWAGLIALGRKHDDEMTGYLYIATLVSGGIIGYWAFASAIDRALGASSMPLVVALMLAWFAVPVAVWRARR